MPEPQVVAPKQKYQSGRCSEFHDGPPLSYGAPTSAMWSNIVESKQHGQNVLSRDNCIIDDQFFFIVVVPLSAGDNSLHLTQDVGSCVAEESKKCLKFRFF